MKNYKKYAEEIKNYVGNNFCNNFVIPVIRKGCECLGSCEHCRMLQMLWLLEEYEEPKEPEVDWSKVAVDTPILVKEKGTHFWNQAYFAQYKDGVVWAWCGGRTSWNESVMKDWEYAKLAETEGAE